jgi:hypothetical protein
MSSLPLESSRRANTIFRDLAAVIMNHRTQFFSEPAAENFVIYMSIHDAEICVTESTRRGDLAEVIHLRDGDHGTVLGLPFLVDAKLLPGTMFVGYRITIPEVAP